MPETVVLYKIVYHGVKCACVRREGIDKMKDKISRRSFLAAAAVSAAALAVSGCDAKTSKKEVTDITVWNYYNGDQLESFNRLVRPSTRPSARQRASGCPAPVRAR